MSSIVSSLAPAMTANSTSSGAGAGAGAAAAAGGGPPQGPSTDEVMVYWLDIALLCVVGAFFLAFLPRTIGRFSNLSEWTRGLVLRSGAPPNPTADGMVQHISPSDRLHRVNTMTTLADNDSDQSHTLANHNAYPYAKYAGKEWAPMSSGVSSPPKHVPALSSILHPISSLFSYPVSPSGSIGKVVVMGAYLGAIVFIALINGGNPLASTNRLGFIAMSQIPVAVALGTKNNVVGMLLGMGYERLNFLHRWVGVITFGAAHMHAVGYIYKWAINNTMSEEFQTPLVMHGMMGLSGVTLLFLTSGLIRQHAFTLFLFAHVTGMVLFFVGICFHQPVCTKYVLLGVGIYALDHVFRLIKTRVSTARISAVPELGLTRVEIRGVAAGWRAGQHVRLRVLSGEMGVLGWSVAHPFTIASAGGDSPSSSSSDSGRGLVLMCKKAGGWTNRLYAAASRAPGAYAVEDGYGYGAQREMRVIVEGPYGGLGNMVMSSYSSVLLIAGGSGLTFALGQAEELVQAVSNGKSAVKFIELVWITQDRASLNPLLPTFSALLGSVAHIPGVVMRITTHYSRPDKAFIPDSGSAKSTITSGPNASLDAHLATLTPNLTLHPGRPPLPRILDAIARLTSSVPRATGLAVGVCGPPGLVQEVRQTVRGVDGELRSACGGVELHEEMFSC